MTETTGLALFPLQAVLFPGGLLHLRVFEARYLDLVGQCLRLQQPFGVIALKQGREVRTDGEPLELESVGTMATLLDVDSTEPGILKVSCRGTTRFNIGERSQQDNGLWVADVTELADDEAVAPAEAVLGSVRALANAIGSLKNRGTEPFLPPFRFDDAGWVANRWCELLPISLAAKQKLMELPDPVARLQLVDEFLRSRNVLQ
jgi:Lon protease-like protein